MEQMMRSYSQQNGENDEELQPVYRWRYLGSSEPAQKNGAEVSVCSGRSHGD
jgi:hypothetical protein